MRAVIGVKSVLYQSTKHGVEQVSTASRVSPYGAPYVSCFSLGSSTRLPQESCKFSSCLMG